VAADRLYLDHAATTPMLAPAKAAMVEAMDRWANPSSPHGEGRAARAALEDARSRIAAALGWRGHVIFTSGASEAIAIGLTRSKARAISTSPVEHDSVLRVTPDALRLQAQPNGLIQIEHLLPALKLDCAPSRFVPAGNLREARLRFERLVIDRWCRNQQGFRRR